jgi:hypothetical protein
MIAKCYNGCWDSETQARFNEEDTLLASIRTIKPEAHCTYFPSEGTYQVHVWGEPLSGFHSSRMAALQAAWRAL